MSDWYDLWPDSVSQLLLSLDIVSTIVLVIVITVLLIFKERD